MVGKIFVLRTMLVIFISLLPLSCDLFDFDDDTGNFWAKNTSTGNDYKVKADLIYEGNHCTIWVEKGCGVTYMQAEEFANSYDQKIHNQMINAFGIQNPSYNNKTFSDIMEAADYFGDGDGKLCILLLDIKDDYKEGVNESYVAGYFWAGNFTNASASNYRDMIYIDTYPGMKGKNADKVFTTLAHEMQHMMNFITSIVKRSYVSNGYIYVNQMDTWIDEGLSSAAEYIVGNDHLTDRISWYNNNGNGTTMKGLIDQGNNFFVWNNRVTKNNPYPILDDYATVYLFFQWLRIQNGGNDIYRKIISSTSSDHQAVVNAAPSAMGTDWETLLKNWMAANYINSNSGIYGYKGDIQTITTHTAPANANKQISLFPGEGVYSKADSGEAIPSQGAKIKYAGLTTTVSDSGTISATGRLLTYNINTKSDDGVEIGTTTGKASVNITPMGRSADTSYSGPYRIGADDLLSRNGKKRDYQFWNLNNK